MRTPSIEDACFFSVRVPYSTLNKVGPPFTIAKLVYKLPLRWFYDTYNYSMQYAQYSWGKPTYNWGAVWMIGYSPYPPSTSTVKKTNKYGQFPPLAMQDLMAHISKSTGRQDNSCVKTWKCRTFLRRNTSHWTQKWRCSPCNGTIFPRSKTLTKVFNTAHMMLITYMGHGTIVNLTGCRFWSPYTSACMLQGGAHQSCKLVYTRHHHPNI